MSEIPTETSPDNCWDAISQELVNGAVDYWSKQLLVVVRSQGGLTEHHFSIISINYVTFACCKFFLSVKTLP